jgi:hypothetical protein
MSLGEMILHEVFSIRMKIAYKSILGTDTSFRYFLFFEVTDENFTHSSAPERREVDLKQFNSVDAGQIVGVNIYCNPVDRERNRIFNCYFKWEEVEKGTEGIGVEMGEYKGRLRIH